MFPSFNIGKLVIPMYSLMIAIGVFFGLIYAYYVLYFKERVSKYTCLRLAICAAISGVFLYLGASFFDSLFHSIEEGRLVIAGITWLGGVVTAFPICLFLIHRLVPVAKGRALYTFSLIIPSIVLAHGFGRIGCFFAGCCYGAETNSVFGVTFPGMDYKVLPTQLFEATFEFLLFGFMAITRKKNKGRNLEIYFIVYGIFRFILEFFRGDSRGGTGIWFTPAQLLDILIIIWAVLIILFKKQKIFKKLYQKCVIWNKQAMENAHRKRTILESAQSPLEIVKELYEMKENGLITEEEYESKKIKLLDKLEVRE